MSLYDFNNETETYLENIFNPQYEKQLEKCKRIIDYEFDPWEVHRTNFNRCRKCVSEFQKMNAPVELVADLKLYLAEAEVHYCTYGDHYDDFYSELLDDFEDALEYISSNELSFEFAQRILSCSKKKVYSYDLQSELESAVNRNCWVLFEEEEDEETQESQKRKNYIDDYDDSDMDFGD